MGKLEDKIALITGGNSGIGFGTAKLFVAEGAHVYITGRRQDKLDRAVAEIASNVTAVQGDVASLPDLNRLYEQIRDKHGKLDIVFANAGAAEYGPLRTITEEHFDKMFLSNVKGMVFTVQTMLPLLPDGASIIVTSSIVGSRGLPNNSVYSATKATARSFARTWTTDLKARRIRVNALSPGATDTERLRERLGDSDAGKQLKQGIIASVPLGRFGTPEEMAKAALFLASDDSSYITGIELFVDGGMAQV